MAYLRPSSCILYPLPSLLISQPESWGSAAHVPGVQAALSYSEPSKHPREESLDHQLYPTEARELAHLDTKTVTSVFGGTVLPLISEPVVWLHGDSFPLVTIYQFLQITNPHTSTHNLSNTRNKDINTFGIVGIILQTRHVERFEVFGEMNKHNGSVDLVGHFPLGSFGDIITVDVGSTVFLVDTVFGEVLDGVSVIESHEGSLWSDKVWVEGLDDLSSDRVGKEVVDDITDDALEVIKQVFECDEDELGFEMGVLGQMSDLSASLITPRG